MNHKPGHIPMNNSKVAVIIVNWNGWRDTEECLESLQRVTYQNFSVYVVDNGSTDDSVSQLETYKLSPQKNSEQAAIRYKLIRSSENLGFAGGNNIGIKKSLEDGAEHILLLNNDTVVSSDFLSKLIEAAQSDSKIGIIGPKIYFPDDSQKSINYQLSAKSYRIWFGGGKLNWLQTRGYHLDYEVLDDPHTLHVTRYTLRDVDYVTGCCLLIKKSAIERIGLLSEDYFLYYEDVDWCLRAKKAGFRIAYVPSAHIWHKVSRSAKSGSASYVYYHVRNGLMLSWRHGDILRRAILALFILWTAAKQIIKLAIPSKRTWAKAALKGACD